MPKSTLSPNEVIPHDYKFPECPLGEILDIERSSSAENPVAAFLRILGSRGRTPVGCPPIMPTTTMSTAASHTAFPSTKSAPAHSKSSPGPATTHPIATLFKMFGGPLARAPITPPEEKAARTASTVLGL